MVGFITEESSSLKFNLRLGYTRTETWSAQFLGYFNHQRTHPKPLKGLRVFVFCFEGFFRFLFVCVQTMNQSVRMNLQWSSPAPCIRTRRVAHKRLDSDDQPPTKCARLSAEAGDSPGLLGTSPGSPVSPVSNPIPATHVGPSRIGPFLLLPLADRESMHSAMNTDTGDELLCKVCAIARHCAISLNECCFKTPCCPIDCLTCHKYSALFFYPLSLSG